MQQRPVVLIFIGSMMIASCLPVSGETAAVPADKLAEIQARGTRGIETDADYTPQSGKPLKLMDEVP